MNSYMIKERYEFTASAPGRYSIKWWAFYENLPRVFTNLHFNGLINMKNTKSLNQNKKFKIACFAQLFRTVNNVHINKKL